MMDGIWSCGNDQEYKELPGELIEKGWPIRKRKTTNQFTRLRKANEFRVIFLGGINMNAINPL